MAEIDYFENIVTYESGPFAYEDFPRTAEPVHILGETYVVLYDREEIRADIKTRLWFTYRKGFSPIGGTGPTSDNGWGCMLRCGQMMLAHALIVRHLGRGWRWHGIHDERYKRILQMFQDKKNSNFSIHQIASMGVCEGKAIGQWFGPNTIAQVLKKLVGYDDWSSLIIQIAMDNTVILDDIRCSCKCKHGDDLSQCEIRHSVKSRRGDCEADFIHHRDTDTSDISVQSTSCKEVDPQLWRPLLLIIPLRLGLTDTNVVYVESLKKCMSFKQSVGMIGGKPNHAHWFIGYVGDELVYLDPHTTQLAVDLDEPGARDDSFHCNHSSRMKILDLDPSVALGFYCGTEAEFDDLCTSLQRSVTNRWMFELHNERPLHWPPYEPNTSNVTINPREFHIVDWQSCGSEEEFELVE